MKSIAYFLILFLFSSKIFAQQEYKESDIPATVLSSFKDKFTPEGKVSWFNDAGVFSAKFKTKDQNIKAGFSSEGKWIDTKYEMEEKELPTEITTYITSKFKDAKIKESSLRESAEESDHYYIILKKEKVTSEAELFFDIKGNFLKQNVPDDFNKSSVGDLTTATIPADVLSAFSSKLPEAVLSNWKVDGNFYTAYFVNDDMKGRAQFTSEGIWNFTKYTVAEKELPGTAMSNYKTTYSLYKIKTCELVQEPAVIDYYYVYAKNDGIGHPTVELYYSLTGKLIKKLASNDNKTNNVTSEEGTETETDNTDVEISKTTETISAKELPSPAISYIKKTYYGYAVKEAIMDTTDDGTIYYVKIKKEGKKAIIELSFDMNGKCLTKEENEE
jgi:hypothetical protein